MNKYVPSRIGNTESLISLKIDEEYFGRIDLDIFIKNYRISNFFKGKFFFIRLVKKIFKYKLKSKLIWNPDFWNNINIVKTNATISISEKTYNEFEFFLKESYNHKRLNSIYKYKKLIEDNQNLGYPLYITGDCLNYLGACTNENELFMLDGSRRLIALLLAKKRTTELLIVKLKNN